MIPTKTFQLVGNYFDTYKLTSYLKNYHEYFFSSFECYFYDNSILYTVSDFFYTLDVE